MRRRSFVSGTASVSKGMAQDYSADSRAGYGTRDREK
jgi:hypothetical protein